MSVRITVDLTPGDRRLERAQERAQFILANQVQADSNNYVPQISGDLKRYSIVSNDNKSVIWTQPYARFQYYNQFTNYTKPGTGPYWDQVAKSRHLNSWLRIVGNEYR